MSNTQNNTNRVRNSEIKVIIFGNISRHPTKTESNNHPNHTFRLFKSRTHRERATLWNRYEIAEWTHRRYNLRAELKWRKSDSVSSQVISFSLEPLQLAEIGISLNSGFCVLISNHSNKSNEPMNWLRCGHLLSLNGPKSFH